MKRDRFDAIVSDLVRERADWTCENPDCGYMDAEGQATKRSKFMQASHFNGRGSGTVARYSIDNVRCLCGTCHHYVEERPAEHTRLMERILGPALLEIVEQKTRAVRKKLKPWEKEEMLTYYREQLRELRQKRVDGVKGYINVVDWF